MLQRALEKAKKDDDKKVSINFQVPSLVKEGFEKLCKENGVSVTAMLNSLMQVALEENNQDTLYLLDELKDAKQALNQANGMINNGDDVVTAIDGSEIDFGFEAKIASAKIDGILAELKKRGTK